MKGQRMDREDLPLDRRLRQEILYARERVYRFGQATPMERIILPGNEPGPKIAIGSCSEVRPYPI